MHLYPLAALRSVISHRKGCLNVMTLITLDSGNYWRIIMEITKFPSRPVSGFGFHSLGRETPYSTKCNRCDCGVSISVTVPGITPIRALAWANTIDGEIPAGSRLAGKIEDRTS